MGWILVCVVFIQSRCSKVFKIIVYFLHSLLHKKRRLRYVKGYHPLYFELYNKTITQNFFNCPSYIYRSICLLPDNTLYQDQPGRPWVDQHRKWRNSTDCWDRREVHVLGLQPCGYTRPCRSQNGGCHSNISCGCSYSRSPRDWVDVRRGLYSCVLSNKSIKRLILYGHIQELFRERGESRCNLVTLLYLNVNLISLRL